MKIKSVTIEGLHNCKSKTYNFDNLTYLYGYNGAGKSTVLNAIQLALLGYIPGTDKKKEAIFRHASEKTMMVHVILEDGVSVKRTWIGAGSTIVSDVEITPDAAVLENIIADLELPIFNFGELLGLTANKLKDWFIQFLPNASGEIDWRTELSNAVENVPNMDMSIIDDLLSIIMAYDEEGVEQVRRVNMYLKDEQSAIKSKITQLQNTINSLFYYDDAPVMSTEEIQAEINKLLDLSSDIAQYEASLASYNRHRAAVEAAKAKCPFENINDDPEYTALQKDLEEYDVRASIERCRELEATIAEGNAKIASNIKIINSDSICPFTQSKCDSIASQIKALIEENAATKAAVEDATAELTTLREEQRKKEADMQVKMRRRTEIEGNYKMLASILTGAIEYEPLAPSEMTSADIRTKITTLQSDLSKIEANKRYNELIDTITKDKFRAELELEAYKIWTKLTDANGLQTKLAAEAFGQLADEISNNLSALSDKAMKCSFHLSEKANSFSFGVTRDEKYIPFDLLSSGEQCIYTLALMMCIVERCNSPLKLIMIDDLFDHLDDGNATKMFNSLAKLDSPQFILAGVKECKCDESSAIITKVGE